VFNIAIADVVVRQAEHELKVQASRGIEDSLRAALDPFLNSPTRASEKGTHMIKSRIAGSAALVAFGFAALGSSVVAIAAPANATPSNEHGAGSTSASAPAGTAGKSAHVTPRVKPQPAAVPRLGPSITSDTLTNSEETGPDGNVLMVVPDFMTTLPAATGSSNGPTSKVGSAPTSSVSSTGGAQTSSNDDDISGMTLSDDNYDKDNDDEYVSAIHAPRFVYWYSDSVLHTG
jgi:hypothetical protein